MTTPGYPELQALVSEDCQELLTYLLNEQVPGAEAVVLVSHKQQGLAALENVVLQIARAYAICAFEQDTDLEMFTPRLQASLDSYPDLLPVVHTYQAHVDLRAVNEDIEEEALSYQTERLQDYLGQFLPGRLE